MIIDALTDVAGQAGAIALFVLAVGAVWFVFVRDPERAS